ncbi:MAG: hypothetical protein EB078_03340, partial [Proteobacteria bacterium]|nr:hypothetical protein [Pseudomonadota bacterium]
MKQLLAFTGMFLSFHVFSQVPAHYISSIELNVREPSSELMNRSQQLVVSAFKKSIELSPHLRGKQFKTQTVGPEVIFTLTSDSDLQVPVQEILSSMVEGLNGRVLAHG